MANRLNSEDRKDHEALIADIEGSAGFKNAEMRRKLLRLLFTHPEGIKGESLEDELRISAVAVRRQITNLRESLTEYAYSPGGRRQNWLCELPKGKYILCFTRITKATRRFWQGHLEASRPVIVLCNELMFYQDFKNNKIIRFTDVNPEETLDKRLKVAQLRRRHPEVFQDKTQWEPIYLYLVSGEIVAADRLNDWFDDNAGQKVGRKISRLVSDDDVFGSTPILLGTSRTNRYIRKFLLHSKVEAGHFCYGFTSRFGEIEIREVEKFPREKTNLRQRGAKSRAYQGGVIVESRIESEGYAFGVVWRMQLPGARNSSVTIIGSDSTLVMQQLALALTDEEQMRHVLEKMNWPLRNPLPSSFEWLFAAKIEPANVQFAAGTAELIGWRLYS